MENHVKELLEWAREEKLEKEEQRLSLIYTEAQRRYGHYTRFQLGLLVEKVLDELV